MVKNIEEPFKMIRIQGMWKPPIEFSIGVKP